MARNFLNVSGIDLSSGDEEEGSSSGGEAYSDDDLEDQGGCFIPIECPGS